MNVCAIKGNTQSIVRSDLRALLDDNVHVEVVDHIVAGLEMARMGIEFKPEVEGYERFPEQERETPILVTESCTEHQTVETLHVSPKTVDGHPTSLDPNLESHERTDVANHALRRQLIELWLG